MNSKSREAASGPSQIVTWFQRPRRLFYWGIATRTTNGLRITSDHSPEGTWELRERGGSRIISLGTGTDFAISAQRLIDSATIRATSVWDLYVVHKNRTYRVQAHEIDPRGPDYVATESQFIRLIPYRTVGGGLSVMCEQFAQAFWIQGVDATEERVTLTGTLIASEFNSTTCFLRLTQLGEFNSSEIILSGSCVPNPEGATFVFRTADIWLAQRDTRTTYSAEILDSSGLPMYTSAFSSTGDILRALWSDGPAIFTDTVMHSETGPVAAWIIRVGFGESGSLKLTVQEDNVPLMA